MKKSACITQFLLCILLINPKTNCVIDNLVPEPAKRNYLSHNTKKIFQRNVNFHSRHKNRAALLDLYKILRNLESSRYEILSITDRYWFDDNLEIIENVLKTLDFNIDCDITIENEEKKTENLDIKLFASQDDEYPFDD